jgi:hypothetical protein
MSKPAIRQDSEPVQSTSQPHRLLHKIQHNVILPWLLFKTFPHKYSVRISCVHVRNYMYAQ